jgi:hypothetical protein
MAFNKKIEPGRRSGGIHFPRSDVRRLRTGTFSLLCRHHNFGPTKRRSLKFAVPTQYASSGDAEAQGDFEAEPGDGVEVAASLW